MTYDLEAINTLFAQIAECMHRNPARAMQLLGQAKAKVREALERAANGQAVRLAAPQASAEGVRQGWKLVPVEPTESMVVAGFESAPDAHFSPREEWVRYEAMTGCQQAAHRARLCWAAMLAAAPAAEDSAKGAGDVQIDIDDGCKAVSGQLLELDSLLADLHRAVWHAAQDEAGIGYDIAGAQIAKAIQRKVREIVRADRQQRGGDDFSGVQPPMRHIAGVSVDVLRRAALAAQSAAITGWHGWACQYPGSFPRFYGAKAIAELNHDPDNGDRLFRVAEVQEDAQPAVSAPAVPLEIVAMLNAATGSNEWQGDHPPADLTEPACKAIAALAAHKPAAFDIEAAAKALADAMDYPWEHMPDQGRENMRKNARKVLDAAAHQRQGEGEK